MKKSNTVLGVVVAVALVAAFAVPYGLNYAQGNLNRALASSCSESWSPIFKANGGRSAAGAELSNVTVNLGFNKLDKMVQLGCDFKVVREDASGGFSSRESYECDYVATFSGDKIFQCSSDDVRSLDGSSGQKVTGLNLGGPNPELYFSEGEGAGVDSSDLTLFARR